MRHCATVGLIALAILMPFVALGQDAPATDARLLDPAFTKVRNEAIIAATCGNRKNPVAMSTPSARNPEALTRDRLEGAATTEGVILIDGSVNYTRVVKADNPEVGKAALRVLKQHRYIPATCSGKRVPALLTMEHTFSLR